MPRELFVEFSETLRHLRIQTRKILFELCEIRFRRCGFSDLCEIRFERREIGFRRRVLRESLDRVQNVLQRRVGHLPECIGELETRANRAVA